MYLLNAFSLSMVPVHCRLAVSTVTLDAAMTLLKDGFSCAIDHAPTAAIVGKLLDREIVPCRQSVSLSAKAGDDVALVAQYIGPRLLEGAVKLPLGAKIEWRCVTVRDA